MFLGSVSVFGVDWWCFWVQIVCLLFGVDWWYFWIQLVCVLFGVDWWCFWVQCVCCLVLTGGVSGFS